MTPVGSADAVRGPDLFTVADYRAAAARILPAPAFDYIDGGAADEVGLRRDRELFDRIRLRPHVMTDVSAVDPATTVIGTPLPFPIIAGPSGDHGIAHPDAELATAAGVASTGTLLVASMGSTRSLEEIASAAGPRWLHLPLFADHGLADRMVARARAAGYQALCLTVDHKVTALRERNLRNRWSAPPTANLAAEDLPAADWTDPSTVRARGDRVFDRAAQWDHLSRLVEASRLPVVVKGVLRGDDADLAVRHGAAAVIVSDHGARQLDGTIAPMEALPEVVAAVGDRAEVLVDGGIRRGTDVVKALAAGARAVLLGRPILWGLAVAGADGVAAVIGILRDELVTAMAMCGAATLSDLTPDLVVGTPWGQR